MTFPVRDAQSLPMWRRPITLLAVMAFAMPMAFSTWSALLNNFVIEVASFDGSDIGWLHGLREVPGFLAVGVIYVLIFMHEQRLAVLSLLLLGAATAVTAQFPSFTGLMITTLLGSIGFHYYETVKQSLELQWLTKARAPQVIGWLMAVGSAASLIAYVGIVLAWTWLGWSYNTIYVASGGICAALAIWCWAAYPWFQAEVPQRKEMVLRRRYWLYYALQAFAGARRQIFMVFAAFMMVERFGFEVHHVTGIFLANYIITMMTAPLIGRAVTIWGERNVLIVEYIGLICIFGAYGGIYVFGWGAVLGAVLYILDHIFFGMAMAQKTYFQKIADPADIAPTAAVAFTINHIGAVFLPVVLGYLWLISPTAVFLFAAFMAFGSLLLSLLIPRHPLPGYETILTRRLQVAP